MEGFVWLGLDGILSPAVAHSMGAAFMLCAQELLPFLVPLSVFLFEHDAKSRKRMVPFVALGLATALYILWALTAYPFQVYVHANTIVYTDPGTANIVDRDIVRSDHVRFAVLVENQADGAVWGGEPGDSAGGPRIQAVCVYVAVVRPTLPKASCVIILIYFWRSSAHRPFLYAHPI